MTLLADVMTGNGQSINFQIIGQLIPLSVTSGDVY